MPGRVVCHGSALPGHPGNLFVQPDGRIGLIDFGMVGEVDEALREALSGLLIALAGRDPRRVALAVVELTSSRGTVNVSTLATDLEPILERYAERALGDIPIGTLIQDVLTVVRQHHLRLPRRLALLSKMLVMAEGLGTELDPEFQLGQVIGPYARRLVAGRYSPEGIIRQLRRAGVDVLDIVAELPVQLRRMRDLLDAGGPEVHLRTAELEPVIDRLEATGRRLEAALLTAALIRTLGDIVRADPRRRRSRTFSVLATALGAAGAVGAYRALTLRPHRRTTS